MKINRGDSQDKGSQSRQAYHAAPAPAPKRPVQPDPDPQDLYEDAEGPDEYAEDDDDEPVRRRFPIGLVVLVVILAIVGIGGGRNYAGGGSLLHGIAPLLEKHTRIHTVIAEDPVNCVAIGTGKSFQYLDKLVEGFVIPSMQRV